MVRRRDFTKNNRVRLLANGEDFVDACVETVDQAREKILFQMYIFEEDEVSERVVEALLEKSGQGVKVFFLLDAFGSPKLSQSLKERLGEAGVYFSWFAPLLSRRFHHIGRRLHQKLLVCDNRLAVTGGMNLAKKFIRPDSDKPWLDYGVVLEGEEVYRAQRKTIKLFQKYFPEQKQYLKNSLAKQTFSFERPVRARTVVNDFMRFKTEIHRSYLKSISQARHSVKITATYFLPGKRLLRELRKAAARGVKIELVFGERSDHNLERWSSRYLYPWYLKRGIEVYEWGESILHAKAALIDGKWVSIGSYNHNYISRYACLELNVEVLDKNFAQEMEEEFQRIKAGSRRIDQKSWQSDGRPGRSLFYFLTYALANMITFVSLIFIFRSKEETENS